jgi:hypothetical protein
MKPRDGMIELLLRFWRTRGTEVHGAQFLRTIVAVRMHFLSNSRREKRSAQK